MVFTLIFQCLTSIQSTYLSCSKFLLCGLAFKVIHASCPQFTQSNQVSYSRSVQRSLRYSTAKQLGILPREQCISKHMVDRPWPCQNEYPRCFILNIMRSYVSNNNAFNVKPPPPNHSLILERQGKLPELCEQSQCSNTDHTFTHLRKYWHRSLPSSDWLNL